MIVNEPLGAAEYDDQQPFGCPYHGLIQNGKMTLPNGQTIDYPQPDGSAGLIEEASRSIRLNPDFAPTLPPETASDISAGKHWQNTARINGDNGVLHGQALGSNCWLWAEAPGRVWQVDPSLLTGIDPNSSDGAAFSLKLSRFGWLGTFPALEPDRVNTPFVAEQIQDYTLPADMDQKGTYQNLGDYYQVNGCTNTVKFRLIDTNKNGSKALFGVCPWRIDKRPCTSNLSQYNIVSVLLIDLESKTCTLLFGRSNLVAIDLDEDQSVDHRTPVAFQAQETCSGQCGAGCGTSTYTHQVVMTPTTYYPNAIYIGDRTIDTHSISRILVGIGFDAQDAIAPVFFVKDEHYIRNDSGTCSVSGQVVTNVTTAPHVEGCAVVNKSCSGTASGNATVTSNLQFTVDYWFEINGQKYYQGHAEHLATSSGSYTRTDTCDNNPAVSWQWTASVQGKTLLGESFAETTTGGSASGETRYKDGSSTYDHGTDGPLLPIFWYEMPMSVTNASIGTIQMLEIDYKQIALKPFCVSPNVYCLAYTQQDGESYLVKTPYSLVVPFRTTYQSFINAKGALTAAPIERLEQQTVYFTSPQYRPANALPLFAAVADDQTLTISDTMVSIA